MHREQKRAVTTAGKGGCNVTVKNIYGSPHHHTPEEHHDVIEDIQKIVQGMQTLCYEMEGPAQANAVLTRSNSAAMTQLKQMNVMMNAMQAQLNTLASEQTNQEWPKRNHFCWSCGRNYTHGNKTSSTKKGGHQEEAHHKKRMVGSEKGR